MAVKSRVNELMVRLAALGAAEVAGEVAAEVAGEVAGLAVVAVLDPLLLPQALAISPAPSTSTARARLFFTGSRTPCFRGCRLARVSDRSSRSRFVLSALTIKTKA
jgi:hypothetical protein